MQVSPIKLQVFSSSSLPAPANPDPNPGCFGIRTTLDCPPDLSIKLAATSNSKPCSPAGEFFRQLSVSSVLLVGLGLNSIWAFPSAAAARIPPASTSSSVHQQESLENVVVEESENFDDEDMELAFEKWKSKSYALTVPLRVVALEGSFPPVWLRDFLRSQGKRVRFRPEYRRSLGDIFYEIADPYKKGKINPKSAMAADLVTLGDSWLNFAISQELIEPIQGAEDQDWFQELSDKWKEYLRRSSDGNLDSGGRIYAVPYRWGSMVIAYNKKEFQKHKLAPVEDWSDLWRPELARKISMVNSPREIVGTVLKYMGASYNTTNIESQVLGGKQAVLQQLQKLVQQVRFFDTKDYLKAFRAGQVWVAVGWSSDVLPFAKTLSNVSVIVPKSGASLWADFWTIPATSRLVGEQLGGRVRGPSPLVGQWIQFCLQPQRALPFKEEIASGASPISLEAPIEEPLSRVEGRPKLDTNLIANVPPADILSRCEFLEPLSENVLSDYEWLMGHLQKPDDGIVNKVRVSLYSAFAAFLSKMQFKGT